VLSQHVTTVNQHEENQGCQGEVKRDISCLLQVYTLTNLLVWPMLSLKHADQVMNHANNLCVLSIVIQISSNNQSTKAIHLHSNKLMSL